MRTSLNEIQDIDRFLLKQMSGEDSALFQAKVLTQRGLHLNLRLQQKIFSLLKHFHRKKVKQDIEQVHDRLFSDPLKHSLQKEISQLFNS